MLMTPSLSNHDHLNHLTGLIMTSKLVLPVTQATPRTRGLTGREGTIMVVLLGLTAAMLYGTGDFLGGLATRRAPVLMVLMLAETAGVIVALPAASMSTGPA